MNEMANVGMTQHRMTYTHANVGWMDTAIVFIQLGFATVVHKVPLFLFDFHKMERD